MFSKAIRRPTGSLIALRNNRGSMSMIYFVDVLLCVQVSTVTRRRTLADCPRQQGVPTFIPPPLRRRFLFFPGPTCYLRKLHVMNCNQPHLLLTRISASYRSTHCALGNLRTQLEHQTWQSTQVIRRENESQRKLTMTKRYRKLNETWESDRFIVNFAMIFCSETGYHNGNEKKQIGNPTWLHDQSQLYIIIAIVGCSSTFL